MLLGLLIATGFYGLLWGVTAVIGRTQVRAAVLRRLKDTVGAGDRREPQIDVWTNAPAALLIVVHYRLHFAPVDARGAREVHVWIFGMHVRVHTTGMWIS